LGGLFEVINVTVSYLLFALAKITNTKQQKTIARLRCYLLYSASELVSG